MRVINHYIMKAILLLDRKIWQAEADKRLAERQYANRPW